MDPKNSINYTQLFVLLDQQKTFFGIINTVILGILCRIVMDSAMFNK